MSKSQNPSSSSYYVSNEFYEKVMDDFSDWQQEDLEIVDLAIRDSCRRFLQRESRYLQDLRLDDWLTLYEDECLYWAPGTPGKSDPRREVAVVFDDRRRMEDRVYRLQMAYAWSQRPASRTIRSVSNVEVYATAVDDIVMVRSNLLINEFWAEEFRIWGAWCGHRLKRNGETWKILVKQVNLIDCDRNLRNPSIIL